MPVINDNKLPENSAFFVQVLHAVHRQAPVDTIKQGAQQAAHAPHQDEDQQVKGAPQSATAVGLARALVRMSKWCGSGYL